MTGNEEELNVRETARLLGVHENTVRNLAASGKLPVLRRLPSSGFKRFSYADVKRMRDEMFTAFAPMTEIGEQRDDMPIQARALDGEIIE